MKKTGIIFFYFTVCLLHAQVIDAYKEELDFKKENTFGIQLNTNGGSLGAINYRHSVKQSDGDWYTYLVEFGSIKHNKEFTTSSSSGSTFTYGKMNYLFILRTQLAQEKRLFWKGKEDGVRLTWVYSAGPSLAFVKPYYIEYDYTIYDIDKETGLINWDKTEIDHRFEGYDPINNNDHRNASGIIGGGGFFKGFSETTTHLGFSAKTSLNFEFGIFDRASSGIETGIMFDYFFKEIRLYHPPAEPTKFFSSIFLTFYFGKRKK